MLYLNSQRKYLNETERIHFYQASLGLHSPQRHALCLLLLDTGCRLSEALNVRSQDIDFSESVIVIHTLKQRRTGLYRVIPLAPELLELLSTIITQQELSSSQRIWPVGRTSGWKWVKQAMRHANLSGIKSTARGLRHGFGIACAQNGLDVTNIQELMGHAKLETTKIYLRYVGKEQHMMVSKTWARPQKSQNSLSKIASSASIQADVNRMSYSVDSDAAIGISCENSEVALGLRISPNPRTEAI